MTDNKQEIRNIVEAESGCDKLTTKELNRLIDSLAESLSLPCVSGSSFTKEDLKKAYNNGSRQGSVNGMRVIRWGEMNLKTFDEWYSKHYR